MLIVPDIMVYILYCNDITFSQPDAFVTCIKVQFMRKAVEEVERCRMTLKWTYAMAYYLAKGNETDLFEDNQRYVLFP